MWEFMEASIFIRLLILPFEAHDLRMKERLLILKRKVWLSPNEEKEKKVIWKKIHVGNWTPIMGISVDHYTTITALLLNEAKYF